MSNIFQRLEQTWVLSWKTLNCRTPIILLQIYHIPWIYMPVRSVLAVWHQLTKTEVRKLKYVQVNPVYLMCSSNKLLPVDTKIFFLLSFRSQSCLKAPWWWGNAAEWRKPSVPWGEPVPVASRWDDDRSEEVQVPPMSYKDQKVAFYCN